MKNTAFYFLVFGKYPNMKFLLFCNIKQNLLQTNKTSKVILKLFLGIIFDEKYFFSYKLCFFLITCDFRLNFNIFET